jgi:hypothetical protein
LRLFFPAKGLRGPSVRAKSFIAISIDYRANLIARLAKLRIETIDLPKKKTLSAGRRSLHNLRWILSDNPKIKSAS